jgi:ribosomal protein S27E
VFLVQHMSGVSVSYALNLCFLYGICRECLLVMHSTCVFSTAYVGSVCQLCTQLVFLVRRMSR